MTRALCWAMAGMMLAAPAPIYADVVKRRGAEGRLEGDVVRLDDSSLVLRTASGAEHRVTWDRVRSVSMDKADPKLEEYLQIGAQLWRARARLERDDAALGEPLFERLFARFRGATHETALVVAEGLLRCRLSRGAHDAAMIPALETARLRRAGIKTDCYRLLPALFDERTGLCMALTPAWVVTTGLVKLERDLGAYDAGADTVTAAQAALYRRAVRQHLGMSVDETEKALAADNLGVGLLHWMTELGVKDAARRNAAREAVVRELPNMPAWAQAWSHYFLGLSLLGESGTGRQESGMVELLHLPARFGALQPYLTGLALAKIAEACEALGDPTAAATLRAELAAQFPQHPVLATLRRAPPADSSIPSAARIQPATPTKEAP